MLAHAAAMSRLQIRPDVLQSLPLANRIENQHYVTEPRQCLSKTLIRLNCLASRRVPAASYHARQRQLAVRRNIEIGGDRKIRPALEDDLLDFIRVALDDARHAG